MGSWLTNNHTVFSGDLPKIGIRPTEQGIPFEDLNACGRQLKWGYSAFEDTTAVMAGIKDKMLHPNPETRKIYAELYENYRQLYRTFGQGTLDTMHRLRALRQGSQ